MDHLSQGLPAKLERYKMTKVVKKKRSSRKTRLPVAEVEVRRLGYKFENPDDADAILKKRRPLQHILQSHPRLQRAWDRGQFLRNLRDLARKGFSVSKAAKELGFVNGRVLQKMIDEDEEIGELWKDAKFQVYIDRKLAIIEAAKKGDPAAIRAVGKFLLNKKENSRVDLTRLTISQLSKLTRRTTRTIYNWIKSGLPRNADGTFDFKNFFKWFEKFVIERASAGKEPEAVHGKD